MKPLYLQEFPSYDDTLPTLEGFEDSSWHNDACPSLIKYLEKDTYLQIFCDYKNKELSDFADILGDDYARFSVSYFNPEQDLNSQHLFQSNDWADIEQFIENIEPIIEELKL